MQYNSSIELSNLDLKDSPSPRLQIPLFEKITDYSKMDKAQSKIKMQFSDLLGKSVIFTGESGKGKTKVTSALINSIINRYTDKGLFKLFIFDMAPERFSAKDKMLGGKLTDFLPNLKSYTVNNDSIPETSPIIYYNYENIIPPRSRASNGEEIRKYARLNYSSIQYSFSTCIKDILNNKNDMKDGKRIQNSPIFFIVNDLSIYFHHGSPTVLLKLIEFQKKHPFLTIILNSYEGTFLLNDYNSGISAREQSSVDVIKNHADFAIKLI